MSQSDKLLTSYIPSIITRSLIDYPSIGSGPSSMRISSALLFADISGFTSLTEYITRTERSGIEKLSVMLSDYFGRLIEIVSEHGGDFVKFSGDGILALWPQGSEDLCTVTRRATQCALEATSKFNHYRPTEDITLFLKVQVEAGDLDIFHVGGVKDHWNLVVTGDPLLHLSGMNEVADAGNVIVSTETWSVISDYCLGYQLSNEFVKIGSIVEEVTPQPLKLIGLSGKSDALLRRYVPDTVLSHVDAGQAEWLAELRWVTVIFVNLFNFNHKNDYALDLLQSIARTVQEVVGRYSGSIQDFGIDDKGLTLFSVFGLPEHSHEDDPLRAIYAAFEIQKKLSEMSLQASIGISSGRVFCGPVGNPSRKVYTLYGDEINLAARLMNASQYTTILCDESTYELTNRGLQFEKLPAIVLKGKSEPVFAFKPLGEYRALNETQTLFGRRKELSTLNRMIEQLREGVGGLVIIEGEAGIGKSALVNDIRNKMAEYDINCFEGRGSGIENSTPYYAWHDVFSKVLELNDEDIPEVRRAKAFVGLGKDPDFFRFAPLLNAVFDIGWREEDGIAGIEGQARADKLNDLLLRVLQRRAELCPLVIVLEDAHWMDSVSWALTLRVFQQVSPVLMVIAIRPPEEPVAMEYTRLSMMDGVKHLILDALSLKDAQRIVCSRLNVSNTSAPVMRSIYDRSGGNPMFIEELAYEFRDTGRIVIREGTCEFLSGASETHATRLPAKLEDLIESRIDQLSLRQQLMLKVASVIGQNFTYQTLHDIHPIKEDQQHLKEFIKASERLNILRVESQDPNLTLSFKHVSIREAVYERMLSEQQKHIHYSIAQWYEQRYFNNLSLYYPLLARHWREAGSVSKSLEYWDKAGSQALRNSANQEAVEFFSQALKLDAESGFVTDGELRARWELKIGEAYVNFSDYEEGKKHLEEGLLLLKSRVPDTQSGKIALLVGQVLRQCLHRLGLKFSNANQEDKRETLLLASSSYDKLTEVAYFTQDQLVSLISAFRALNMAEVVGPSSVLARGYAILGVLAGFIPYRQFSHIAEYYLGKARLTFDEIEDDATDSFVSLVEGYYFAGVGKWSDAQTKLEKARALARRIGDQRREEDALSNLMGVNWFLGRFATSLEQAEELLQMAKTYNDQRFQLFALQGKAYCLLHMGNFDDAYSVLNDLENTLDQAKGIRDRALHIEVNGILTIVHLKRSDFHRAISSADKVRGLIAKADINNYATLSGYSAPAEVYISVWEAKRHQGVELHAFGANSFSIEQLDRLSGEACRMLKKYAKVFPIGWPRYWLLVGKRDFLKGNSSRAYESWNNSLNVAEKLSMRYDAALAHYEIGRNISANKIDRKFHINAASEIFASLGCEYFVEKTCSLYKKVG